MKKIIIILIVIVIISTGCILKQSKEEITNQNNEITHTEQSDNKSSENKVIDENLKTYINYKYNFQIDYPTEWFYVDTGIDGGTHFMNKIEGDNNTLFHIGTTAPIETSKQSLEDYIHNECLSGGMVGGTNILFEKLVDNNTTLGYISKCKRTYTPNEIYTQDETVISTLAYFEPKSKDTKYRGIRLNLEDNNFDFDLFKQTASTFRFLGNQETLSSDWIINLSDQESKSNVSLEKNNLLYATKKDFTVTVYKKSLQTDSQEIILEYNEFKKAESSGSWWTKSKPSISLSPDNNSLAFIDQEGLKIYDLLNKNTTTIISKIDDNYPGMPSWSITDLEAYHLFHPKWSSDSQYISFSQSLHEGSFIGVINIKNNEYTNLRLGNGLKTVTWSPIGNTLAKANDGGYSGVGLWIISDNIKNSQNIAETFNLGGMSFYDVNFSSSGDKVIFTFKDNNNYHLSISDIDGSNYKELDNGTSIKSPIFSRNDDSIYYIKQNYLYSFNLETSEISNIATIPESFTLSWTDDDHLILDGSRTTSIINLENEEILYSRPVSENFFKFMEIIN